MWIDDAVEMLSRMEYTCQRDFVLDHPDGADAGKVASVFGVSRQAIEAETQAALKKRKRQFQELRDA